MSRFAYMNLPATVHDDRQGERTCGAALVSGAGGEGQAPTESGHLAVLEFTIVQGAVRVQVLAAAMEASAFHLAGVAAAAGQLGPDASRRRRPGSGIAVCFGTAPDDGLEPDLGEHLDQA